MIKADEQMKQLVNQYNGLYMCYSDDFIVVVSKISDAVFKSMLDSINNIIKSVPNLVLQPEKTQLFKFRDKTISKYYYRLYRKLKTIVKNDGFTSSEKR